MNREERLRRELPDGLKDRAAELAGLPTAHVNLIVAAVRASHRAGREREKQVRCQRRTDRRKYNHVQDDDYTAATTRVLGGLGRRAGSNPETLAALDRFIKQDGPAALALAVDGCRARGFSDGEIAAALGTTRQAVGQRFGRKGHLYAGTANTDGPA
jgi:hypothetical protein